MCPHTTAAYVSSYYCYICVLILLLYICLQKPLRALPGSRDAASMLLTKPLCYELNLYAAAVYTQEPLRALPGSRDAASMLLTKPLCYELNLYATARSRCGRCRASRCSWCKQQCRSSACGNFSQRRILRSCSRQRSSVS